MGNNSRTVMHTFQDGAGALGNGVALTVNTNMVNAILEIYGTGTSSVIFEGRISDAETEVWYPIGGVNLLDHTVLATVTTKGVAYQVSLLGLLEFRVRVSAFTSGAVTVKGVVVN